MAKHWRGFNGPGHPGLQYVWTGKFWSHGFRCFSVFREYLPNWDTIPIQECLLGRLMLCLQFHNGLVEPYWFDITDKPDFIWWVEYWSG